MLNINSITKDLNLNEGIWTGNTLEEISFPSYGYNSCFALENRSFWFKNRNEIICEVIKEYSKKGPIFDVGGGNGYVTNGLTDYGFEAILVEPGLEGCLNARERGLKNIINSVFDTNYFYLNSIPNIGIFDVLEHIDNQNQFLKVLHSILIPDGRLFITVPAFNWLWSDEDNRAGHFRRYRIKELQKIINENGFEMQYATYFFYVLILPIFLFRTIPSKWGFYKIDFQKTENQLSPNSWASRFFDMTMKFELERIRRNKSMIFGSSILMVAKKR